MNIKTLPTVQDAKFITIEEGPAAIYADELVAGWIKAWKDAGSSHMINLFLFSSPESSYKYLSDIIGTHNLKIYDYYTQDLDKLPETQEIDLEAILKSINVTEKTVVIVNCLSSLIIALGLAKAVRFVEKLSTRVYQLICIYRRDTILEKVPRIETLGTTYVKLSKSHAVVLDNDVTYDVQVTHRKRGGGIVRKQASITQNPLTFEITSEKTVQAQVPKPSVHVPEVVKPQASFRIDMNAKELEQRNKIPLPYTINNNANSTSGSKIIYVPDEVDDFDEEDPDDDLPF